MRLDLSEMPTADLFSLYRSSLNVLKERGVIRTMNAPAGDYAEYLVGKAFVGTLAPNSAKSWDVLAASGDRLQVKCRVVSEPIKGRGQRQLGVFRTFDFDALVIVLLGDTDYRVVRAVKVPQAVVVALAVRYDYSNGFTLFATDAVLNHADADDVTERVSAAAHAIVR